MAIELLDHVDLIRLDVGRRLNQDRRAEFGQFFTPAPIARFMAGLSELRGEEIRLLDSGAGIGSLSAAWIADVCGRELRPKAIHLTAYEIDPELVQQLHQTVKGCKAACDAAQIDFTAEVVDGDFILAATDQLLAERPLLDGIPQRFNCAILNPPYRKLTSQSTTRRRLSSLGIETSNLYAAFLWLTFKLLHDGGELIAITPRSFCNGPYFRPFREALLKKMTIRRIHVFESRKSAFQDASVLQENIIFRAVKNRETVPAVISSSAGPDDPDICFREVSQARLVDGADSIIHIVPDELGTRFAEQVRNLSSSLVDLGIQVSTGRVVDFRAKEAIVREANGTTVPLIYPVHFERGYIEWPKQSKKPNYLKLDKTTKSLLVPPGHYVLVKRFSAKEERRRVTAAVCDPSRLPEADYGFENHLNYYHRDGEGLQVHLSKGLAAYLNSTLVDSYFRQFSGHTQVNASDLRSLHYPDVVTLERIGRRIGESFPDQEGIDELIREEIGMTDDDPVQVKLRITAAQEILKALGMPKAQQNERSALTLLSLADLRPDTPWSKASAPHCGISQMMDWFAEHYGRRYAENTRESVRRQTIHQMLEAGIIVINPDDPERPTNSGKTVYQIEVGALELLRSYDTKKWKKNLGTWLASIETLKVRYAKERDMKRIPLKLATGDEIALSPGGQNILVKHIMEEFCPRFTPAGKPIYVGDTATKWAYFNERALKALGVTIDSHGKMPDVVIYYTKKKWLVLIEAVTSHGPVDGKRRDELKRLFQNSKAGLVFVTAFLDRAAMVKYLGDISWETEVWIADAPSHMIHFNGERFLGPYDGKFS